MEVDPAALSHRERYRLLIGVVVPRPIAWVTTLGTGGIVNAAPFSCYTFVSTSPPMLAIVCGRKHGASKDTVVNARRAGDFVVNVVTEELGPAMNLTSGEYPPETSEAALAGLDVAPSGLVGAPRLRQSPVNLECRFDRVIEFGDEPSDVVIGTVVRVHVRDDLWKEGRVDSAAMRPLSRLGGPLYSTLGSIIRMERPAPPPGQGGGRT
jgi:flavin reductase (DIM6/NTAB) family NADH-FMN oxidoreductase RutF